MANREMTGRNRSKHIGHASEGHLRGLLLHVPGVTASKLSRALPFATPVESDAILFDDSGKIRAIFIVAFWDHAGSSEKKLYRTRTEFNEIGRARSKHPEFFAQDFRTITVLYGSEGGWKEKVLTDLLSECAPGLFLPRLLGVPETMEMVDQLFSEYAAHWVSGRDKAREHVENWVAGRSLTSNERKLLRAIKASLAQKVGAAPSRHLDRKSVRLPNGPTRTRYRQSLGMLSLFPNEEIESWLEFRSPSRHLLAEGFVRRATFLDMGNLTATPSITRKVTVNFTLRSPQDDSGDYAPGRPDFSSWQECPIEDLRWILDAHREKTRDGSVVFAGGALDQCFGNYSAICAALASEGVALVELLKKGDLAGAAVRLASGTAVSCEAWHPAAGQAVIYPLWGMSVCALAVAASERSIRSDLDARRQEPPDMQVAREVAKRIAESREAQRLLDEVIQYAALIPTAQLEDLARAAQPRLLQLDEPCSWLADAYMTLTTNSSHNPLNEILVRWLAVRFPKHVFQGWPGRRSIALSVLFPGVQSRRQWCTLGHRDHSFVAGETKAVTANNWGNKSKELYDRVSELRKVANSERVGVTSILLFDGDLSNEVLVELGTGIGHEEVWTVDEVLAQLRSDQK
jgi:hypothetical protein